MHLELGRVQAMCEETDVADTNVICHQSAGLMGTIRQEAWCRGSVDRRPGGAVRLMRELGVLTEITPDGQLARHEAKDEHDTGDS